jgi:hypothetical protein
MANVIRCGSGIDVRPRASTERRRRLVSGSHLGLAFVTFWQLIVANYPNATTSTSEHDEFRQVRIALPGPHQASVASRYVAQWAHNSKVG